MPAVASGSTALACYFQKGSDVSWWGLTSDSGWFSLPDEWQTTQHTKLQKFLPTSNHSAITRVWSKSATC